jgi:hypothetical protein
MKSKDKRFWLTLITVALWALILALYLFDRFRW